MENRKTTNRPELGENQENLRKKTEETGRAPASWAGVRDSGLGEVLRGSQPPFLQRTLLSLDGEVFSGEPDGMVPAHG
jgi:hypothetical protein